MVLLKKELLLNFLLENNLFFTDEQFTFSVLEFVLNFIEKFEDEKEFVWKNIQPKLIILLQNSVSDEMTQKTLYMFI